MKVYEMKVLVEVENEGINGSYPTPYRIRDYVVTILGACMGRQKEMVHEVPVNIPIKDKSIFASIPEPMKENMDSAYKRLGFQDKVFKAFKKAMKGIK